MPEPPLAEPPLAAGFPVVRGAAQAVTGGDALLWEGRELVAESAGTLGPFEARASAACEDANCFLRPDEEWVTGISPARFGRCGSSLNEQYVGVSGLEHATFEFVSVASGTRERSWRTLGHRGASSAGAGTRSGCSAGTVATWGLPIDIARVRDGGRGGKSMMLKTVLAAMLSIALVPLVPPASADVAECEQVAVAVACVVDVGNSYCGWSYVLAYSPSYGFGYVYGYHCGRYNGMYAFAAVPGTGAFVAWQNSGCHAFVYAAVAGYGTFVPLCNAPASPSLVPWGDLLP